MKKLALALTALLTVGTFVSVAAPVQAATSTAPTVSTPMVPRGHTIKVYVDTHDSKVLSRASSLWQSGHRVYDWSPKPGLYKVKSVIKYQIETSTENEVWVPASYCADYSYEGYDGCAAGEYGYYDYQTVTTLSSAKWVTRYTYARVDTDETPGCVSYTEFQAVKKGMTQASVHSIFGTTGHVTNTGSGGTDREYRTCTGDPDWSYVEVDYNPRVWFKWRYISY